jgi:hypothetical protein
MWTYVYMWTCGFCAMIVLWRLHYVHMSYLFSFRESIQDYKIHMDTEIAKFALEI